MSERADGVWAMVRVPALITLAVTVVRLVGEVLGWGGVLFGEAVGGGGGALLGISWLIFVFGAWFGLRVQRAGRGPSAPGRALLVSLLGVGVGFGGVAASVKLGLAWFPDADNPGEPRGFVWLMGAMLLGALLAFVANRRVALTLLVYAVLARVPVVVVTWIALSAGWDTHYTKVGPGFPEPPPDEKLLVLAMPQITFWPMITVLLGTAMGCLAALLVGRRAR